MHDLPFAHHTAAPAYWRPEYEPSTINLATMLHQRPVGLRPLVELEPSDHPLSVEQREGIALERVREIADALLHPGRD